MKEFWSRRIVDAGRYETGERRFGCSAGTSCSASTMRRIQTCATPVPPLASLPL